MAGYSGLIVEKTLDAAIVQIRTHRKNKMKISEYTLKISAGQISIAEALTLGEDIAVMVKGSIVKSEDYDLQDGTVRRVYTLKGEIAQ